MEFDKKNDINTNPIIMETDMNFHPTIIDEIRELRKNNVSYYEIDKKYPSYPLRILVAMAVGVIQHRNTSVEHINARRDEPWKEKYVLNKLYIEQEMRFTEIANYLDCNTETAKKYVDKYDISPINSSNRTSSPRVNKLQRIGAETGGDIDIK